MLDRIAHELYRRYGAHYKRVFLATQIPASIGVALGFVALLVSFYRPSAGDAAICAVGASLFTAVGVSFSILRQRSELADLTHWREHESPTPEETVAAWRAATSFAIRSFRRDSLTTNAIAAIPSLALIMGVLDLPLSALVPLAAAAALAAAYGTIVTYSMAEMLIRPAIEEIAAELPDDTPLVGDGHVLPVRKRLIITLPAFTATAGLAVAALVTSHGGTRMLAISVGVSLIVGMAISHELTLLLSRSITDPIIDLREAVGRVAAGDYDVRVPVVSADDLGELSNAFNSMAAGLAEREALREAFGTYLDKDVAGFVLSGRFPDDGIEVNVTIMFCDVPAFTPFAERLTPREVVEALNGLFEQLVPIITAHGGHVDKFLGDGLLAVFGAPEGYVDHADRALAAGLEIVEAVEGAAHGLAVGVGLNTGSVVAGSIGGAGRLNFSVIGDAVNVAARVEAATRGTVDDLLLTASTREALTRADNVALVSRGSIPLKGKRDPVELFAPVVAPGVAAEAAVESQQA